MVYTVYALLVLLFTVFQRNPIVTNWYNVVAPSYKLVYNPINYRYIYQYLP